MVWMILGNNHKQLIQLKVQTQLQRKKIVPRELKLELNLLALLAMSKGQQMSSS
jgi:hypothetical protein